MVNKETAATTKPDTTVDPVERNVPIDALVCQEAHKTPQSRATVQDMPVDAERKQEPWSSFTTAADAERVKGVPTALCGSMEVVSLDGTHDVCEGDHKSVRQGAQTRMITLCWKSRGWVQVKASTRKIPSGCKM